LRHPAAAEAPAIEDRGEQELKGVPDRWKLYRVAPAT
jgi:hypothetical protein